MKTFSNDVFEFREARILCDNKGARVRVMGELGGPDGVRIEDTRNVFSSSGVKPSTLNAPASSAHLVPPRMT